MINSEFTTDPLFVSKAPSRRCVTDGEDDVYIIRCDEDKMNGHICLVQGDNSKGDAVIMSKAFKMSIILGEILDTAKCGDANDPYDAEMTLADIVEMATNLLEEIEEATDESE